MDKRLYRSRKNKILAGVCGGIGDYLNIDPVIVRLIWVATFFAGGAGLLLYIVAMIIIPVQPSQETAKYRDLNEDQNDEKKEERDENDEEEKDENKDSSDFKTYTKNITEDDQNVIKILIAVFLIFIGLSLFFNAVLPINIFFFLSWRIILSVVLIVVGGLLIFNNIKERRKWS